MINLYKLIAPRTSHISEKQKLTLQLQWICTASPRRRKIFILSPGDK